MIAGREMPVVAEIGGNFFLVIKARCIACGNTAVLLDKDLHGWDGFICHDPVQAALPRPALTPWSCLRCQGTIHRGIVTIHTEGKQDFIREAAGYADADRWPDGFGWFSLDTTCAECGLSTERLIDYETM